MSVEVVLLADTSGALRALAEASRRADALAARFTRELGELPVQRAHRLGCELRRSAPRLGRRRPSWRGGAGEAPIVSPAPTPSPDAQALAGWIVDHTPVVDRMTAVAVEDDPRLLVAPAVAVGVPVPVSPEVHREVVGLLREAARRG